MIILLCIVLTYIVGIIGCWVAPRTPFVTWVRALISLLMFTYGIGSGSLWLMYFGATRNWSAAIVASFIEMFTFGILIQIIYEFVIHKLPNWKLKNDVNMLLKKERKYCKRRYY